MGWNAEDIKKKLKKLSSEQAKQPHNSGAADALGGLSGRVVDAKKKRKKALEDAAKGL